MSNAKSGIAARLAPDFVSLNPGYACLYVRPEFFFEGVARRRAKIEKPPMIGFLDSFPNATDDYALVRSYLRIKDAKMKRHIVALVQAIAGD